MLPTHASGSLPCYPAIEAQTDKPLPCPSALEHAPLHLSISAAQAAEPSLHAHAGADDGSLDMSMPHLCRAESVAAKGQPVVGKKPVDDDLALVGKGLRCGTRGECHGAHETGSHSQKHPYNIFK